MPVVQSAKTSEITDIDQKVLQVRAMVAFGLSVTSACMKASLPRRTYYYRLEKEKPAEADAVSQKIVLESA